MIARCLAIFAALLVLQGSILRTCEWETLLAGTNCHQRVECPAADDCDSPLASAVEQHSPVSQDDHDSSCPCARAKLIAGQSARSADDAVALDLPLPASFALSAIEPVDVAGRCSFGPPQPVPLTAVNLPLLS